jgi:hypothetical protein
LEEDASTFDKTSSKKSAEGDSLLEGCPGLLIDPFLLDLILFGHAVLSRFIFYPGFWLQKLIPSNPLPRFLSGRIFIEALKVRDECRAL